MARLCQRAENEFVGLDCGIPDQHSSLLGQEGQALSLDCCDVIWLTVPLLAGIGVVICDTQANRDLTGSQ